MKKNIFCWLVFATMIINSVNAQLNFELNAQLQNKDNLTEVMGLVDNYYRTKNTDQALREWKHWKRWQWEMSRYVNADGKLVNTRAINYRGVQQARLLENNGNNPADLSSGSWTSIGPNSFNYFADVYRGLGRVNRIAFHPDNANILYAGTPNGGLWRTTDGGSNWSVLNNYGPELGVSGIIVSYDNPNVLYVLTGDGDGGGFITNLGYRSYSIGVMKSTDGGVNWTLLTNGLPVAGFRGYSIAQCPSDPDVLIIATDTGVYQSRDGGLSWSERYDNFVSDVKFKPGSANICYAAGDGWFRKSVDTGATWNTVSFFEAPTGANRIQIAVTPAADNYVYFLCGPVLAVGSFKGIWRSTNSGDNFTKLATTPNILGNVTDGQDNTDQSGYDLALAVSSTDPADVYAAGTTIWKSTNGGNTFSFATTYIENGAMMSKYIHPDIHDVQVNPLNGDVWAATDGGVYRSTNDGIDWTDLSSDISTAQPYHLDGVENNSAVLYIGTQDNGLKNRYGFTTTWEHYYGRDGFDVAINYDDNALSYASINQSVRRFSGNGANSTGITPNAGNWFATLAIDVNDPAIVYCGHGDDVFKSTNSGDDWANTGASGSWCITTCPSNSQRVYAAGGTAYNSATGNLYRSDNGADDWSIISENPGFPETFPKITSIGVNPTNSLLIWVTFGGTTGDMKVFFSGNGGDTWSNISSTALPNVPINCIAVTSNNDVYIGTDIGVYYRPSGGVWTPFYNGLPMSPVSDIELNETSGVIRASLFGRGVWSSTLFSTCLANLAVSGSETGIRLYEASNSVSSSGTTTVEGGNGTEIYFKGGMEVHLTDGFQVKHASSFKAYINDCGEGGIPSMFSGFQKTAPIHELKMPSDKQRLYPYGNISFIASKNKIIYRVHKPGNYSLQQVDTAGNILKKFPATYFVKGVHEARSGINSMNGTYIQLLYEGQIVHYQELF